MGGVSQPDHRSRCALKEANLGGGVRKKSTSARRTMMPATISALVNPGMSMTGMIPSRVSRSRRVVIQRGTSVVAMIELRT